MNDPSARSLRAIWYNRGRIIAIVLASVVIGGLVQAYRLFVAPTYTAKTTVTMLPSYSEIMYTLRRSDFDGQNPALVLTQTQTEFLLSRTIASTIVDQLVAEGMIADPDADSAGALTRFVVRPISRIPGHVQTFLNYGRLGGESARERLVTRMQRGIRVGNVPGSYILSISVTWPDPEIAQRAANLLANTYMETTREQNRQAMALMRRFAEERINEDHLRLREVEGQIRDLKSQSSVYLSLVSETPLQLKQLEDYVTQKSKLELRSLELRARIESGRKTGSFTDTMAMHADYVATRDALKDLRGMMARRQAELDKVPATEFNLVQLQLRKEQITQSLEAFQEMLIQAGIAETSYLHTVRVIDAAKLPTLPSGPGLLTSLLVALAAGLLLALGSIVVSESFSNRVRAAVDIPEGGMQYVGLVPRAPESNGGNGGFTNPWSASPPSVDKHAAYIVSRIVNGPGKVVYVETVRGAAEHVGTLTHVLRQCPESTLVISLDARLDDRLASVVGRVRSPGVPKDTPTPTALFGGRVRYLAWPESGSDAWLASDDVKMVTSYVEQNKGAFSMVLVLSPSIREFPWSAKLASCANEVVLLVRSNGDTKADMEFCQAQYGRFNRPIGVVLTDVDYPGDYMFA